MPASYDAATTTTTQTTDANGTPATSNLRPNPSPNLAPQGTAMKHPNGVGTTGGGRPSPDPSRLAPEDAFLYQHHHYPPHHDHSHPDSRSRSPPPPTARRPRLHSTSSTSVPLISDMTANGGVVGGAAGRILEARRKKERDRERDRGRSGSRRRKGQWKKLLWVKQAYPDNYTDEETFLDHLQRNPRLQPYEFWPLVADSTVIVQHVMSVVIFICCFTGIVQERVTPFAVVSSGSLGTVLGWVLWDFWVGQEEDAEAMADASDEDLAEADPDVAARNHLSEAAAAKLDGAPQEDVSSSISSTSSGGQAAAAATGLGLLLPTSNGNSNANSNANSKANSHSGGQDSNGHSRGASVASVVSNGSAVSGNSAGHSTGGDMSSPASHAYHHPPLESWSTRNQRRVTTIKSAVLIYCALLGLSPILKSLTKSTTSDSIWAMTSVLMCINVCFFDYGGGVGAKFPASLSTNAAIMAASVLASRLESTTDVFSFLLFSIEVFGLFPVFRRHLRFVSWPGHLTLTIFLVMGAGAGFSLAVSGGTWKAAITGVVLGSILTSLVMGICSWWLIGLQKYKNEIHGPWDPAQPIIRRRWD
ncbi:phosphatidylinositol N-acetylglucosaminyltransferase-domain-containing protein [Phyllosticta paracitricarpa]|uniref:Phosphatidylinositol N-acetylglucosaminyltransferase-domain-containing protein n=1 Tax=Phyllosticta paracitricarpa TaxID=2016321 RepID=A0ABR1NHF5_9PEZI